MSDVNDRKEKAQKIITNANAYKVCEGCDSIVTMACSLCPNCHSYRFDVNRQRVIDQATWLASRPQSSVTMADMQ